MEAPYIEIWLTKRIQVFLEDKESSMENEHMITHRKNSKCHKQIIWSFLQQQKLLSGSNHKEMTLIYWCRSCFVAVWTALNFTHHFDWRPLFVASGVQGQRKEASLTLLGIPETKAFHHSLSDRALASSSLRWIKPASAAVNSTTKANFFTYIPFMGLHGSSSAIKRLAIQGRFRKCEYHKTPAPLCTQSVLIFGQFCLCFPLWLLPLPRINST